MKQKMKKIYSLFMALALILGISGISGISAVSVQAAEGDVTITLVEATDIHGHLVDPGEDAAQHQYRLAYMAKMFNDYRSHGSVIALNGGDTFQGTPMSNLTHGKYLIQALNTMKFDVTAVGNHEFDWGIHEVMANGATLVGSTIPVVASNIYLKSTGQLVDFAKPYVMLEREGKKIAVIGWADEYSADIMAEKIAPYIISEDASLVNGLAKQLKEGKEADAVVVLAHDDAKEAVEKFEGGYIDVLFGGHSHQVEVGTGSNGIPYGQGNKEARGFAKATMTISADNQVTVSEPEYVDICQDVDKLKYSEANAGDFDPDMMTLSNQALKDVEPLLNEQIAELPVAMNRDWLEGSLTSVMGNWITDMMRYDQEVDFAFCNDGGIRTDFDAKMLTVNDIYTVAPFDNLIYKVEMTGAQIVKLLEQIVGNDLSCMQMSGLTAKYDLSLPEDEQVFDVRLADGTPLDLNKTYSLLTNKYIATGGNNYTVFLTDVVSSVETSIVDNVLLLENVKKSGKEGPLKVDTAPRLIEGTKPADAKAPSAAAKKTAYVGQKFSITIQSLADDAKVTYSSSNKTIAAVNSKGKVTAKKKGAAVITAKVTQNGMTYRLKVKVTVKNPVVKLTASTKQLKAGTAYKFRAKAYGIVGAVKWTSSNPDVASVTGKGKVTAKAAGNTTITATAGGKSAPCKLTVTGK